MGQMLEFGLAKQTEGVIPKSNKTDSEDHPQPTSHTLHFAAT